MKKILLILVSVIASYCSYAQTNTFPSSGNVGIGTTNPSTTLDIGGLIQISAVNTSTPPSGLSYGLFPYGGVGLGVYSGATAFSQGIGFWTNPNGSKTEVMRILSGGNVGIGTTSPQSNVEINNGSYSNGNQLIISGAEATRYYGAIATTVIAGQTVFSLGIKSNYANYFQTLNLVNGNIGIGTTSPQTKLHIVGNGASIDGSSPINGDNLAIQGNTGGRSTSNGAQLEFVIPANTDGTNLWGQARIITTAGNSNNGDATGKMILGTRRFYNKLGSGTLWYYGNDIVIDGNGNVGIGTTNPGAFMLAVKGNVHAQQVNVDMNSWADYVFKKDYQLPALTEVKTYIDQNQHLPDMPSEQEVIKDGLNLGEINKLLTKKVEELTLYLIEKDKQLKDQQNQLDQLKKQVQSILNK